MSSLADGDLAQRFRSISADAPVPASADAGRYRVAIRTAVGWSNSRATYKSRRNARRAALWLASLYGVHEAHVLDDENRTVAQFKHPRSKPR
ncbi:MAG: hypothetical protein KF861_12230 [Planctomycetaceae bacterium]|nr:hypothetical protein [Planctomycetaceae bacterium]